MCWRGWLRGPCSSARMGSTRAHLCCCWARLASVGMANIHYRQCREAEMGREAVVSNRVARSCIPPVLVVRRCSGMRVAYSTGTVSCVMSLL